MLKCKRTFDYLSLYDTNQEQATAASYYPSRKRLCNEFDEEFDTAAPLNLNCFETQGLVLPKIPLSPPSTKTQFPIHSFSSPLLCVPQNENSPNNSKLYCINNNNNNNSIFNSPPIFSQNNNNYFSNTNYQIKNNQVNNISNNNNDNRRFNLNKNINNVNINNNNNNNNNDNGDKIANNYFIVSKETIGNIQFPNKAKKEEKESNPLLDQLIQTKLSENKYKKNEDFIFTIDDIKEIVLKAIKERDEELHEEFSAQFSEKLFEQQEQFASYSEEKISAQLRNSKHNYMS